MLPRHGVLKNRHVKKLAMEKEGQRGNGISNCQISLQIPYVLPRRHGPY